MNPNLSATAWAPLSATAALLAFLVGLYALVGRERKTPYLINSVFSVLWFCFAGAAFDIASVLIPRWNDVLLKIGLLFLLLAVVVTFWRVWAIWIRLTQFVDPPLQRRLSTLFVVREGKRLWRKFREGPTYEQDPVPLTDDLKEEIREIVREAALADPPHAAFAANLFDVRERMEGRSLCMALRHQGEANEIVGRIAVAFLNAGHCVQYLTSSRHPIEFIAHLKQLHKDDAKWPQVKERIVAVDAYTPHFGFTDSIYAVKTSALRNAYGISLVTARATYAGLHSASREAFNLIKGKINDPVRQPALVIYEDTYALSDIESAEQYRIFVRHVLPSERIWDGMFTVFVETAQLDADWELLRSYASMIVDFRSPGTPNSEPIEGHER